MKNAFENISKIASDKKDMPNCRGVVKKFFRSIS